jgi:hypothetical protein
MMKVKTPYIVVGILLAAALWLTPALSRAEATIPQAILDFCREATNDSDAEPDCMGQCVSLFHVCVDEQTGEFDPPPACRKKLIKSLRLAT